MKGCNELHLNELSLIEAIQEWLDKRMTCYAPTVVSVKQRNTEFVVTTDSEKEREPAKT